MRKLLYLIPLLLIAMVSPVFGSDYHESAMYYLTEKYDVLENKIEIHEGGITELEFTDETFWGARYVVMPERTSSNTEPIAMPLPELSLKDSGQTIMELLPRDAIDAGYIYGGIYIRIKTGEILELDEMEPYYTAEWKLVEKDWERLRKESGKLDVPLYLKLQSLSDMEKLTVWIQPSAIITDEIRAKFAALKEKYPEISSGIELADILSYGYSYGYTRPGSSGDEVSSSDGSSDSSEKSKEELWPIVADKEHWKEHQAMWEQLEQIRLQAVQHSLVSIMETLDGLGISYEDNGASIVTEMSVAQIRDLAQLSSVSIIYEEVLFTTMDGNEALLPGDNAPSKRDMNMDSEETGSKTTYLTNIIIIGAVVMVGVGLVNRRRVFNNK